LTGNGITKLYLVRHAFAAHADPERWPDDAERPLTPDGIRKFRAAARALRLVVPSVDVVLSSGYSRAWETAVLLHDVTGWPGPLECPPLEAGAAASSAVDILRGRSEESVALVGHEPHLSNLASILCTGDVGFPLDLKKGGVVHLRFDEEEVGPGRGRLRWALSPKILRTLDAASNQAGRGHAALDKA
jgi:phosphohistidine phosphatase